MQKTLDHLKKAIQHLNEAHRVFPSLFEGHGRAGALALVVNARQTTEFVIEKLMEEKAPVRPWIDDLRDFFDQTNYAISIMRGERLTVITTYLLNRLQYLRSLIGKRLFIECKHLGITPWQELAEFEEKEEQQT